MLETPGLEKARRLASAAGELYPRLKAECEGQVVRWEWGTFVLHSLEPAYFEINKRQPGERVADGEYGYGFDTQGRLVLERERTGFAGQFYETFYRWEPGGTARFLYDYHPAKAWINVAWLLRDDAGRVCSVDAVYAQGGSSSEVYSYDTEGRVIGMERRGTGPDGDSHDFRDIEYDAAGRIVRVYWRYPDGRRILDFARPSQEQSFPAVRQDLGRALADAIVAALAGLDVKEPVFALALWWCGAEYQYRLPPNVAIGLDSERERFVEKHGGEALWFIWNPAEWKRNHIHLQLGEPLASQCELANQDVWQNERQDEVDQFLGELARRLAQRALPFPRTDDFVTYAINLDYDTHAEDVSSQISEQAAELLRRRGLL